MSEQTIEMLFGEYSAALDWALGLTGRVGQENRFLKYKTVLKKQLDDHQAGVVIRKSNRLELKEYGEAYLEACVLNDVYKKFSKNTNKYFIEKLSNVFGGEYYASEEPVGTDSLARNFQAELVMASKCKDPNKLTFWGNDIVYNFEEFKFGIEVKRINSDFVLNTFEVACEQIQNKRNDVGYGLVALCIDRFFFFSERNGIIFPKPLLLPRESWMVGTKTMQGLAGINTNQLKIFHSQYESLIREIAKKYPKVAGYCVYLYHPAMVGDPIRLAASGYSEIILWETREKPDRSIAFERFINEQFYNEGFANPSRRL